jgi:hypothetical protein
VARFLVHGEVA